MDLISEDQGMTRKEGLLKNSFMYLEESCPRTVKLSSEDSV